MTNPDTTPANISVHDWQEMQRLQLQNERAIASLIHAIDGLRAAMEAGFANIQTELAAVREENRTMLELLNDRLPPKVH